VQVPSLQKTARVIKWNAQLCARAFLAHRFNRENP
jgi:hypothetical protein